MWRAYIDTERRRNGQGIAHQGGGEGKSGASDHTDIASTNGVTGTVGGDDGISATAVKSAELLVGCDRYDARQCSVFKNDIAREGLSRTTSAVDGSSHNPSSATAKTKHIVRSRATEDDTSSHRNCDRCSIGGSIVDAPCARYFQSARINAGVASVIVSPRKNQRSGVAEGQIAQPAYRAADVQSFAASYIPYLVSGNR